MESTNVEFLFENNSIAEIEEIQEKLQRDVERKKDDLKQLVGQRYRDLIEASDIIHQMKDTCALVISDLSNLTEFCEKANQRRFGVISFESEKKSQLSDEYLLTVKCNFIVRIPSELWTMLDNDQVFEAVYYFFLARNLLSKLDLSKAPPFVHDYTYSYESFLPVLSRHCWEKISSGHDGPVDEISSAKYLACILFLEDISIAWLFKRFLDVVSNTFQEIMKEDCEAEQMLISLFKVVFYSLRITFLVFYDKSGAKSLLFRNLYQMKKTSYGCKHILEKPSIVPEDIERFTLNPSQSLEDMKPEAIQQNVGQFLAEISGQAASRIAACLQVSGSVCKVFDALAAFHSYVNTNDHNCDWNEACEAVLLEPLPVWDTFLKKPVMDGVESIMHRHFAQWSDAFIRTLNSYDFHEPLTLSSDIWRASHLLNEFDFTTNASSVAPSLRKVASQFDGQLEAILKDIHHLVSPQVDIRMMPEGDQHRLKVQLLTTCVDMVKRLAESLESMIANSENLNDLSFLAHLTAVLTEACPNIKKCLQVAVSGREEKWEECRQSLLDLSSKAYHLYFVKFVEKASGQLRAKLFPVSISSFLTNTLLWDDTVYEETDSDGKNILSVVRTPMYISLPLHEFLTLCVKEINAVAAHTIRKTVLYDFLVTVARTIVESYSELFSHLNSTSPTTVKQTFSLQLYFDLLYLKSVLEGKRDEFLKKEAVAPLAELAKRFESAIDPFDLHVFTPRIHDNLSKLIKCSSLLFGLILPEVRTFGTAVAKNKDSHQPELHNLMTYHTLPSPLPLLALGNKS